MRTLKVTILALMALSAVSCDLTNQYVSKAEYEEVLSEYNELKEASDATLRDHIDQAKAMDHIFTELSAISKKTVELRGDIESGDAELTQAEQIESSIADIKSRLAELDRLTRQNKELHKVVDNLNKVIVEKQKEIEGLKAEIEDKDRQIREHKTKISEQQAVIEDQQTTISSQNDRLRQQLEEQARLLFDAGADLEAIADDSPEISLKKNRTKVSDWTTTMYQKALLYYTKAAEAGYAGAAEAADRVRTKIANVQ